MRAYSNLNWWPGNLRLHESRLSLITRFSKLNGISIYEANRFLRGILENNFRPSKDDLLYISEVLNEDLEVVKSVLSEPIRLPDGIENLYQKKSSLNLVRYCDECASSGFHSYLHEYTWLARCPFHGTDLKLQKTENYSSNSATLRCQALDLLMREKCANWPRFDAKSGAGVHPAFVWLTDWLARVSASAGRYSRDTIWRSYEQPLPESKTLGQVIGRLHALEPVPFSMRKIFADIEDGWSADIEYFPQEAQADLNCAIEFGINKLFDLFKRIAAYSNQPYRFVQETRSRLANLTSRHPKCNCVWGRERHAYGHNWVRVHPHEWPQWNISCPYTVLAEEIQRAVGKRYEFLTHRRRDIEQTALIADCRELQALGLVGVSSGVDVSPWGHPYMYSSAWPMYEWVGRPWLNAVFDAAALFELRSVYCTYNDLLAKIDEGEWPGYYEAPAVLIWLSKTEQGLVLIRWYRADPRSVAGTESERTLQ